MKRLILMFLTLIVANVSAATFDGDVKTWKNAKGEKFDNPEQTFKVVLQKLKEKYVDREVTDAELYRAATAGMLAALNTGKENWNLLLSPRMREDFEIEMSGKLIGIGATLAYDEKTGYTMVCEFIPNSAAEHSGLKKDDLILGVNGKSIKGKPLQEVAASIRGPAGQSVQLKVLRDDQILKFDVTRGKVLIPNVTAQQVDPSTAAIAINMFNNETPNLVKDALKKFSDSQIKKMIVDLRGNQGGTFDAAVQVAELLVPKGKVIVQTRARDGAVTQIHSEQEAWRPEVRLVVLTDKETGSGAELLTAALKENRQAMTIGDITLGKWNAQELIDLPNHFAFKFSEMQFESPSGKSYMGIGMKPDIEVGKPKTLLGILHSEKDIKKRLEQDPALKAATEL